MNSHSDLENPHRWGWTFQTSFQFSAEALVTRYKGVWWTVTTSALSPLCIARDSLWEQWPLRDTEHSQHFLWALRCFLPLVSSNPSLKEIPLKEKRDYASLTPPVVGTSDTTSFALAGPLMPQSLTCASPGSHPHPTWNIRSHWGREAIKGLWGPAEGESLGCECALRAQGGSIGRFYNVPLVLGDLKGNENRSINFTNPQ